MDIAAETGTVSYCLDTQQEHGEASGAKARTCGKL